MPDQAIELRILNESFQQIAIIRDFTSLQWTQKYYEPGQFALQCGLNYVHLLPHARYVYRVGTDVLGVIDSTQVQDMHMMRGRFASAQLMERAVNRRVTYTGTVESVCRDVVREFCIEPEDAERVVPHLVLGEYMGIDEEGRSFGSAQDDNEGAPDDEGGAGEHSSPLRDDDGTASAPDDIEPTTVEPTTVGIVTIQPYGKTVYDAIREVLTANEMSFRLRYVFETNALVFEVYQGLDRTQNQTDNDWCVFSSELYNVSKETFTRSQDTRNFAYVVNGNEDNNEDEWIIEIEVPDGRPRAEVWVQDNTKLTEDMTEEEFEAAIRQTGLNKLAEFNIADTGECEIAVHNAMSYGLGDLCTYINSRIGVTFEQRITEIAEVHEPNRVATTVVLGKEQLTEGKKIMRAVK